MNPNYQNKVNTWMTACFPPDVCTDVIERCFRFVEESMELAQSLGMTKEEALTMAEYTWGRPEGQPSQEVGGVMVCLAALCNTVGIDIMFEAWAELERVEQPEIMAKIRAKHAAKPANVRSALPGKVE